MTVWVCSKCGMAGASVIAGRPSLDDRFAVGYCAGRCSSVTIGNPKNLKARLGPRPTVPLVRSQNWDPNELARRAEAARKAKLLRDAGNQDEDGNIAGTWKKGADGKAYARRLTKAQQAEADQLLSQMDAEAAARHAAASGEAGSNVSRSPESVP